MLKNFVKWFVIFGVSFLLQILTGIEQGKAFCMIFLALLALKLLIAIIGASSITGKTGKVTKIAILLGAVAVGIILVSTWGATKLFNVDFYVAFQIMTFGQCLYAEE